MVTLSNDYTYTDIQDKVITFFMSRHSSYRFYLIYIKAFSFIGVKADTLVHDAIAEISALTPRPT